MGGGLLGWGAADVLLERNEDCGGRVPCDNRDSEPYITMIGAAGGAVLGAVVGLLLPDRPRWRPAGGYRALRVAGVPGPRASIAVSIGPTSGTLGAWPAAVRPRRP